jgi:hypothetical protein
MSVNPVKSKGKFQLAFKAVRGFSYRSDIAIDEIVLTNSDCEAANDMMDEIKRKVEDASLANLDLDRGMPMCTMNWQRTPICDWVQGKNGKEDTIDLTRSNQPTSSAETGPSAGTGKFTIFTEIFSVVVISRIDCRLSQGVKKRRLFI